jgi:ATP-dependent DNA helicase RecG
MTVETPIQYVKGVGPILAKKLEKLEIRTVNDFLFFFPRSYDDRRQIPLFNQLKKDEIQTTLGFIKSVSERKVKSRLSIINALLVDDRGANIKAVWFNQPFLKQTLKVGRRILVKGKVEWSLYTREWQILVSESEFLDKQEEYNNSVGLVVPVYALSSGLHQYQMRNISREVIIKYLNQVQDAIPTYLKQKCGLLNLQEGLKYLHFPKDRESYKKAKYSLVFEEFFYHQLALAIKKTKQKNDMGEHLVTNGGRIDAYLQSLPYKLTSAQKRVIDEIAKDVSSSKVMNRLLQGDVGSGKTDVAVTSLLFAIESGKNGAIMAPTEILADQHYLKFRKYLEPLGVQVLILKGKMKVKERKIVIDKLKQDLNIVLVGTHALIQDNVEISDLGLVVIDEQHRFGVVQRMKLKEKGVFPHCLFMTATPIPRTFMLTCYGDLDKSIMDELPPGRKPSMTRLVLKDNVRAVYEFCKEKLRKKQQLYVVYPLVEESEKLDLNSAIEGWQLLKDVVFSEFKVGLIHGRMSSSEKIAVMDSFKKNELQVLVATTVIEVGVDVPNASMLIIHDAERFGLSQLHQLRGRIGRGNMESFCFLMAQANNPMAKRRLSAMVETSDGFKIAEYDLQIRGPGEMLGTRQAGMPDFNLADLVKDEKTLLLAKKEADRLLVDDPAFKKPEHKLLQSKVQNMYKLFYNNQLN